MSSGITLATQCRMRERSGKRQVRLPPRTRYGRPRCHSMLLSNMTALRGPNIWSRKPVLEVEYRFGTGNGRASSLLPHAGLDAPEHMAELILERTLELQRAAGTPVEFGSV